MSRTLLFVVVLLVAAGAPYLINKSQGLVGQGEKGGVKAIWTRLTGSAAERAKGLGSGLPPVSNQAADPTLPGRAVDTDINGPIGYSVSDLLRFDVTPNWVMQTWNLVTSDLPDSALTGMRVPIVTGTESTDVAGSLTYYFNKSQQVERMTLHGFCEDPSAVMALAQQRFALRQFAAQGSPTYLAYFGDQPISIMRITSAPNRESGKSTKRYEIDLELNLPREGALLSSDKLMLLFRMRQADMI